MSRSVSLNQSDVAHVRRMLQDVKGGGPKVVKRAVDRTMGTMKTTISRIARETLNIRKADLDKGIGVKKYDDATASGRVTIEGASLPVYDFHPQQDMYRGVSVQIKKRGARKFIAGAFIATMKSGHKGVFWREWHDAKARAGFGYRIKRLPWAKEKDRMKKYRLKIHELFTTALPEALGDKKPMDEILTDASENLHKNLDRELNYELSKL